MATYEMKDGKRVLVRKTYVPNVDPSPDEVKEAKEKKKDKGKSE